MTARGLALIPTLVALSVIAAILVLVVARFAGGVFVDADEVKAAVERQGYTDVVILDKHIFFLKYRGCNATVATAARFDMQATAADGARIDLRVCSGWLSKAVTIRTD